MCGRFTLRTETKDVATLFDLTEFDTAQAILARPRYNIAPTQNIAAVRAVGQPPHRELVALHWGLVPSWAEDPTVGNRMINARSETLATRPAFRSAFRHRRCLVPADGFYEWQRQQGGKQPYYIHLKCDHPFALAGLWEHWRQGQVTLESCTLITTAANDVLRPLHDRMPVIIRPEDFARWLDPSVDDPQQLQPLLAPYPAAEMTAYPVSKTVNSPRLDVPACMVPEERSERQRSLFD